MHVCILQSHSILKYKTSYCIYSICQWPSALILQCILFFQ
uniref:Uncharacterized protein n=1 Tax=Anguilla anguilla TaxID=7936 RepID=A0A0E9XMU3_ANGAN